MRDPYEVLGVGRGADDGEIRSAFRRLAARHHPDRNPGDASAQARFTELNQAFQILSDPQKRAAWDRFGAAAFTPGGAPGVGFVDLGGIDGLFGDLLGAFGFKSGDRGDVKIKLALTFEEAARGVNKAVTYEAVDRCETCRGSGAEPSGGSKTCNACTGRGRVRFKQGLLPFAVERTCSRCRGTGRIPEVLCKNCGGNGLVKLKRKQKLTIPAGIEAGSSRTIEGAGSRPSPERPAGNLEVMVEVASHPFFRRAGDDVICNVPVTFTQAALGGEVDVPTLDGKVKMRVPPSTQPGSILRLRGKGIVRRVRGGRGDQLVQIEVEIPSELSPRAKELLAELAQELGEDVQPQQRTFVEKLKSLFG